MKLLITICLISYAYALDCSEGQGTWCSSLRAAKQCGAITHCKDTVWNNIQLTKDSSDVCDFCKSIVGDVQNMLTNKETQDEIKKFMESACSVIPSAAMQQECTTVIEQDLPELLLLISEELDPALVCGMLGFCQNADLFIRAPKVELSPVKQMQVAVTGDICADCKTFMGDIKAEITSQTTEEQLEEMIDNLFCARLGGLKDTCEQIVADYVPEIMKMLGQDFDPTMECEAMGFCPASAEGKLIIPKLRLQKSSLYTAQVGSDEFCDTCKEVISVAKAMETNPQVETEIENAIDQMLCSKLGDYSTICSDTVKQYLPEILELLSSEMDPDADCEALGLCSAQDLHFYNLLEAQITDNDMKAMRQSGPKMSGVDASTECLLCTLVIKEIDHMLTQNATEKEIIGVLDRVCSELPKTVSDDCTAFVNTYGPAVLALLVAEVSSDVICTEFGLCSTKVVEPVEVKAGELCAVCDMLIQYVDSLLSENATSEEIEQVLDKVCNFLPTEYRSECTDIIEQYTPELVQLLEQELTPKEVCTELKLCTSEVVTAAQQQLLGDKECTWGPAYWCASKENAAKCGAETHCMKHVWN